MWTVLLAMLAAYVVYLALNSAKRRKNPPITVVLKVRVAKYVISVKS